MDHLAICKQAVGTLLRRGVSHWVEKDELIAVGYLALFESGVEDEALAVVVARRQMIDLIRRKEVRQRVREDCDLEDIRVRESQTPRPDVWEAIKVLSPREYQVVVGIFWSDKTQADIAIEMGVHRNTVRKSWPMQKRSSPRCAIRNPR